MSLLNKKGVAMLLLFTLFLTNSIRAQIGFNNRIDYYNLQNLSSCLLIENDTIFVGVNTLDSAIISDWKISILKMDINGNVLSKKSFKRDSMSFGIGNNILKYNNEYFIPGPSGDYNGNIFGSIYEFNFNLDTVRNIINVDTSFYTYYTSLIKKRSDLYIFGAADSLSGLPGYNFFLRKSDSLGNIIWQKKYGSIGGTYRNTRNMDTTHTNGFVMCGFEQTSPFGWGTTRLYKTDSSGNQLWTKTYGNINTLFPTIVTTKTAGYLVATNQIDSSYMTSFYWMTLKLYRLNENGDTVWTKKIGTKTLDFSPINVKQLSDEDFIICGVDRLPHYDIGGSLVSEQLYGFLCRTDSNGNVKWFHYYKANSPIDTTTDNYLFDVAETTDGSLVATGWVSPADGSTQDVWIIKVDSMGCIVGGCNSTVDVSNVDIDESTFNLYPNPANDFIDIETDFKNCYFSVFDVTGKLMLRKNIYQNKTRIDLSNYANGFYFIQLQSDDRMITKKFIKQ